MRNISEVGVKEVFQLRIQDINLCCSTEMSSVTPHFACSGLLLSASCWLKVPAEKFVIAARFLLVTTGKPYYFVVSSFYTWQSPSCKHEALKPYCKRLGAKFYYQVSY